MLSKLNHFQTIKKVLKNTYPKYLAFSIRISKAQVKQPREWPKIKLVVLFLATKMFDIRSFWHMQIFL